jgi:hypothetical protein
VASPQRKPSIDLQKRFIDSTRREPVEFARRVLNHRALKGEPTLTENPGASWELDQFQVELLEAVADVWRKKAGLPTKVNHAGVPYITIRSGHGAGKTHIIALIAHWFNTAFDGRVVCTAPKLAQLRTRLWSALRKIDQRAEPWYRSTHVVHDTAVYWRGPDGQEDKDWCILAETASHPENLAGHHARFQLVLVDEATGVPEHLFPVIFGALSSGELQVLVMISNPTKQTGSFAASHLKQSEAGNYYRYHINLENSRRINRDWVAQLECKYGVDSPIVQIRAHGNFADASPRQLIPTAWVMDAMDRDARGTDGSVRSLCVSLDVADGGEDETVCAVKEVWESHEVVLKVRRFNFAAVDAVARAADEAEALFYAAGGRKGIDRIVVDSLGVGAGARDILIRRGHSVVEYMGGAGSDDPVRWRNRRVQSYLCLRDALRDGKLDFAEDCFASTEDTDEFLAQLASVELSDAVSGERVEDLVTKTEMKRQGKQSPDIADALAMSFGTQRPKFAVPEGYSMAQALCAIPGDDHSAMNFGGGY